MKLNTFAKGLIASVAALVIALPVSATVIPGTSGDFIPDVVVDGINLSIDPDGVAIASYSIESAQKIFTGDAAANIGMFQEDSDSLIHGAYFSPLLQTEPIELGSVIAPEFAYVDLLSDLTITFNSLFIRGDVNRSGELTTYDLVLMSQVLLGVSSRAEVDPLYSVMGPAVFDVNDDGVFTTLDLIKLRKHVLGILPPLSVDTDPTPDLGDGRIVGTLVIAEAPEPVSEPSSFALVWLAGLVLFCSPSVFKRAV